MNLFRLIFKEIFYRKANFALAMLVVVVSVLSVAGTLAFLRAYDLQTEQIIDTMEAKNTANMKKLEDDIRKSMKGLGFNIHIFPKDQDMSEVYSEGYATKTMPEEYATTLAQSQIVTVNHLLPSLTRKLTWPEKKRTVIAIGVRGEVPIKHRSLKSPLIDPVKPGEMVLGYELHSSLNLKVGDKTTFMDKEFTISKLHKARGTTDDITLWMNLSECQELLELEGRINTILALECNCATLDRLGEIREELMAILPDTQIIETESKALARAEARNQAKAIAKQAIEHKKEERIAFTREREALASNLLPLIMLASMAIIGLLTLFNVRGRITEIGILRAIGTGSGKLLSAFMARAFIVGLAGVLMGLLAGWVIGQSVKTSHLHGFEPAALLTQTELLLILILTPVLSCAAAWLPSLQAAGKDPAQVLRYD